MKKLSFALLTVFAVFVIGCNNSETTTESTATTPTQTPAEQTTPPAQENTTTTAEPVIDAAATTTVTPSGDVKLNPPHGEPGHRCDLAVGAPLPM